MVGYSSILAWSQASLYGVYFLMLATLVRRHLPTS